MGSIWPQFGAYLEAIWDVWHPSWASWGQISLKMWISTLRLAKPIRKIFLWGPPRCLAKPASQFCHFGAEIFGEFFDSDIESIESIEPIDPSTDRSNRSTAAVPTVAKAHAVLARCCGSHMLKSPSYHPATLANL